MNRTELPDVNVLLALLQPGHVAHEIAGQWFCAVEKFATTPVTELGLLRLSLNPKVMGQQVAPAAALASLSSVRADSRAIFLPDDGTLDDPLISDRGLQGHRQVTDFHLVNLAARHGMLLVTLDQALSEALLPGDRIHVRTLG